MSGDGFEGGKGGGPTPFVNAFKPSTLNSLRYPTSQAGSPITIVYGTQRANVNLVEYWGFKGAGSSGLKGGKGLGNSGGKKAGGNFSVYVAYAICQGPINFTGAPLGFSGNNRVWANGSVIGINRAPVNIYDGNDGAAPDPVFATSDPNTPVQGYSGTAYVTGTPLQLGSSPALPSVQFEISGFLTGVDTGTYTGDANPAHIITDMLTNPRYGAGFPSSNIDISGTFADFAAYCQAWRLVMSLLMDRQQPTGRWIDEICQLTVSAVFWSGSKLKIVPFADVPMVGNGTTWAPNLTAVADLRENDFIAVSGSDPVVLIRSDPAQATNWLSLEYMNSSNSYNPAMVPVWNQGAIDRAGGPRTEASIQAHEFVWPEAASNAAELILARRQQIRNTYKFTVGWQQSRLEPMDIVTISDSTLGLVATPVRIIDITENDNGDLAITAEQLPNNSAVSYSTQITAGAPLNLFADPGNANGPIIFEPPPELTSGVAEIFLITSGGVNWGGCNVWISTDNSTFALAGSLTQGARQGLLTAVFPSSADPDNTNILSVNLTESRGQLLSGTVGDADSFVTLCYVAPGELVAYQTAILTSAYHYDLGSHIRRGVYGTPISSHGIGSNFARFGPNDPSVFKYKYPKSFIGQTIYIKLQSFNLFGQELQDLSTLTAYTYVPTGAGAVGSFQIPFQYLGISPPGGQTIIRYTAPQTIIIPAGITGSIANAGSPSTVGININLHKNGVSFGGISFFAGNPVGVFGGGPTTFNAGDLFEMIPNATDATLGQITGFLAGTTT